MGAGPSGMQSRRAGDLLRALELPADLVVTSGEWGVSKPARAFFDRVLTVSGTTADRTLYVGDHPANDIHPARAAGLRTAHIRRGPWGHWWADDPEVRAAADWSIDSLTELLAIVEP